MIAEETTTILKEKLTTWAATRIDEVVFEPTNGYYSFSILADAFEEGKKHAQNAVKTEIRKKYFENSKVVNAAVIEAIKAIMQEQTEPEKIFISLSLGCSKVLMSINEESMRSTDFLKKIYGRLSSIELSYHNDKQTDVSFGLIDESDNMDICLMSSDGFGFMYDFKESKEISC